MYGGALLGQGVYGCAFSPPLKCRGRSKNTTALVQKKVGKLTSDFDAYWESVVSKRLEERVKELASNYFILIKDVCEPDNRKEQTEPDLSACEAIKDQKITKFKQLTMPYGGVALAMAQFQPTKFDIISFTKHLLEGVALLHLSGVVHMDLHMGNILMDEYDVPRFIDFGLAFITESIGPDLINFIQHPPDFRYNQEPPELSLLWAIRARDANSRTPYDIIAQKPIFKDIQALFGERDHGQRLEEFWESSKSLQDEDGVALIRTYWPQIDAWAIGAVLVQLVRGLSFFRAFQNNEIYSRNKVALEKVIKLLVEPNPAKRFDAIEALSAFVKTVPDAGESYVLNEFCGEWLRERQKQRDGGDRQQ